MDKAYKQRLLQLKEIEDKYNEQKFRRMNNMKGSHMKIMGDITSDDENAYESSGNESADNNAMNKKMKLVMSKKKMSQFPDKGRQLESNLEIVKEDKADMHSQISLLQEDDSKSLESNPEIENQIDQNLQKSVDIRANNISLQNISKQKGSATSFNGFQEPLTTVLKQQRGLGDTQSGLGTVTSKGGTKGKAIYASRVHIFTKDKEIINDLLQIEVDLFQARNEKQYKNFKTTFGIQLSDENLKHLDRYHAIKSSNHKARQGMQDKILIDLNGQLQAIYDQKRLKQRMQQEQNEFFKEMKKLKNQELIDKMDKFINGRKKEVEVLNYVLQEEENNSDEEFNVIDQQINQSAGKPIRLEKALIDKIKRVNNNRVMEQGKQKLDKYLNVETLDQVLAQSRENDLLGAIKVQKMKFQSKKRTEEEQKQKDFNTRVGEKMFDEKLNNEVMIRNPVQYHIQKYLADVTQKQIYQEDEHKDALEIYLKQCQLKNVPPLPILNKFQITTNKDGQSTYALALEDYSINEQQIEALAQTLKIFGQSQFQNLYIKNNRISDNMMTTLLEGLIVNENIQSIEIVKNELKMKACQQLINFFPRKIQQGMKKMKVLKLSDTKSGPEETQLLFKALSQYEHLSELKLNNFKIDKESSEFLADAINNNMFLTNIDISWNNFSQPAYFLNLMKEVRMNTYVVEANFSNNPCSKHTREEIAQYLYDFIRNKGSSLQHLNISYMGLGEKEVITVAEACSKCRTLLSVHLTGNDVYEVYETIEKEAWRGPGFTDIVEVTKKDVRRELRRIFRPRKRIKQFEQIIQDPDSDHGQGTPPKDKKRINQLLGNHLQAKMQTPPTKIKKQRPYDKSLNTEERKYNDNLKDYKIIYTRILGHFEMPKSHRWIETQECWYCEKHAYTLILSSKSICEKYFVKPRTKERCKIQKKIENVKLNQKQVFENTKQDHQNLTCSCKGEYLNCYVENPGSDADEYFYDADAEGDKSKKDDFFRNVQFASVATNWRTKSMIPVSQFMKMLSQNRENSITFQELGKETYRQEIDELKQGKKSRIEAVSVKLEEKAIKNFDKIKFSYKSESTSTKQNKDWHDEINQVDLKQCTQGWFDEMIDFLPYKSNTNFILDKEIIKKLDFLKGDCNTEKVYAYACFLPPGKYSSCVIYNNDIKTQKSKSMYTMTVKVPTRTYNIWEKTKKIRKFRVHRMYQPDESVFNDGTKPLDMKKMLEKDISYSKMGPTSKFIKDGLERQLVFDLLYQNIDILINTWLHFIGSNKDGYPSLDTIQYVDFLHKLGIFNEKDKTLKMEDLTTCYAYAQSYEVTKNPKKLHRYGFLELFIVRVANKKYMENQKIAKNNFDATSILMDKYIKPAQIEQNIMTKREFCEKQLWTLEIDDLFSANKQNIQDVYTYLIDPSLDPVTQRPYTFLNLNSCLKIALYLDLTEEDISLCFAFSKKIWLDEIKDYRKSYEIMNIIEFYEFIVRLADFKFKTQKSLQDKAGNIMDILFKLIGKKRNTEQREIYVSSESDYLSDE